MKIYKRLIAATAVLAVVSFAIAQEGEEEKKITKENTSISKVMKVAHKKPKGGEMLLKQVAMGKASKDDQKKLLELYKVMAQHKPPKGDEEGWKKKTELLVEATESVIAGKQDSGKQLTAASNCKACHSEHKK